MFNVIGTAFLLLLLALIMLFLFKNIRRQQRLGSILPPSFSHDWYRQRRMLVSLAMLIIVSLAFSVQSGLASGTLLHLGSTLDLVMARSELDSTILQLSAHPGPQTLSQAVPQTTSMRLLRVNSAAREQYATTYEWETWAYSSCSGIALETVMNAYGRHLTASDVLQVEQDLGIWNVQLGLLRDEGIAMTADYFGFVTSSSHTLTVDQVVAIANQGKPVIVSVRDSIKFPGGHIFVVRGGDAQSVFVVDSSLLNLQTLTRSQFAAMWQGFSAVLTPRA